MNILDKLALSLLRAMGARDFRKWLRNEFGIAPKRISIHAHAKVSVSGIEDEQVVFLIDYVMPDGEAGRGFTGFGTFSFCEQDLQKADERNLICSYIGVTLMLSGAAQSLPDLESESAEAFRRSMAVKGIDISGVSEIITHGDQKIFVFTSTEPLGHGAGTETDYVWFRESDHMAKIPAYYALIGQAAVTFVDLGIAHNTSGQ